MFSTLRRPGGLRSIFAASASASLCSFYHLLEEVRVKRLRSSVSDMRASHFSSVPTVRSASSFFCCIMSLMRSSNVSRVMKRYTFFKRRGGGGSVIQALLLF